MAVAMTDIGFWLSGAGFAGTLAVCFFSLAPMRGAISALLTLRLPQDGHSTVLRAS